MAARNKLTTEQQAFVVQALACFDTPKTVAEALNKEFSVKFSLQAIEKYDPTKRSGRNLGARWKELFAKTRADFIDDAADVAISHRSVRLRYLQRMVDKAEDQRNFALAAQLLEQAAKEKGDAYTNKRQVTGPNGGPVPVDGELKITFVRAPKADGEHPAP